MLIGRNILHWLKEPFYCQMPKETYVIGVILIN